MRPSILIIAHLSHVFGFSDQEIWTSDHPRFVGSAKFLASICDSPAVGILGRVRHAHASPLHTADDMGCIAVAGAVVSAIRQAGVALTE